MREQTWERPRREKPRQNKAALIDARERVRGVLNPELGPYLAIERANNIVQVLLLDSTGPTDVVRGMLSDVPLARREAIARRVSCAWLGVMESTRS